MVPTQYWKKYVPFIQYLLLWPKLCVNTKYNLNILTNFINFWLYLKISGIILYAFYAIIAMCILWKGFNFGIIFQNIVYTSCDTTKDLSGFEDESNSVSLCRIKSGRYDPPVSFWLPRYCSKSYILFLFQFFILFPQLIAFFPTPVTFFPDPS